VAGLQRQHLRVGGLRFLQPAAAVQIERPGEQLRQRERGIVLHRAGWRAVVGAARRVSLSPALASGVGVALRRRG
jgi:hypothetical protein